MTAADRLRAAVEAALPCPCSLCRLHQTAVIAAVQPIVEERDAEIERLRSELQLVTSPHESVGAVLRGHEQTIARLRAVLEAVWITVPSQFSGPETEQHAKVLNSIPRAIAADWPAVRAAGVALPGDRE